MITIHKEKTDMDTTVTTNQRLTTILLVLLIILLVLLVIGILAGFGMMGGGVTNYMSKACLDMMHNIQTP